MPAGTTADYEKKYFSIPKQGCEENKATAHKYAKQEETALLGRPKKYSHNHLLFLHDFSVPFDDNLSERDLRKAKNRQKMAARVTARWVPVNSNDRSDGASSCPRKAPGTRSFGRQPRFGQSRASISPIHPVMHTPHEPVHVQGLGNMLIHPGLPAGADILRKGIG